MARYYCPYCPSSNQIHKKRFDGVMVCALCGDPLVQLPLIKPTQILALIVALAFVAPLIGMISSFIQDSNKSSLKRSLPPLFVLPKHWKE